MASLNLTNWESFGVLTILRDGAKCSSARLSQGRSGFAFIDTNFMDAYTETNLLVLPKLTISSTSTNTLVSWPTDTGFVLESTSNLSSTQLDSCHGPCGGYW